MIISILILLICKALLLNGQILDLVPENGTPSEICEHINNTIYKYANEILNKLDETESRSKRSIDNGKYYDLYVNRDFIITVKLPEDLRLPYSKSYSPIDFFLPYYTIKKLRFENVKEDFTLFEGERCNFICAYGKCEKLNCWNKPTICMGNFENCLKLDGNVGCINAADIEAPGNTYPIRKSTHYGEILRLPITKYFIRQNGFVERERGTIHWECSLRDEKSIVCRYFVSGEAMSPELLKIIAKG